ncbi:alanine racemase [uncultured Agrococcus sp.]|uniref:alanine racemase n=1 Tax=uncultured Agrococcus sp. TaxID=382258 RepID=UPI0025CD667E|nr:alanine racemase [uncultured Agrococcus sp.]
MVHSLPAVPDDDAITELRSASHWRAMQAATAQFSAPLVALSLDAVAANAASLRERAGGRPIRVATKSIRIRDVLRILDREPWTQGLLAFSLAEAIWLSDEFDDILVAYPQTDRDAYRALAADARAASRVAVMIDSVDQLDFIDTAVDPAQRPDIRVAIDLDASWRGPFGHVGVFRSPVHGAQQARRLAESVAARDGFRLVGLMSYEAQIAGVGDSPSNPVYGRLLRGIQARSAHELAERRAEAVRLVREVADLEFVNGGGTGSLESTSLEDAVTDIAAGSGLFGPHLFDHYTKFTPAPAIGFALDVVRKPASDVVTCFGGGWIASGPAARDRLPEPAYPAGLQYLPREGAGEVQTPLRGPAAAALQVGDRVWFRPTKSGEACEHANHVHAVAGGEWSGDMLTYRGEGKVFV